MTTTPKKAAAEILFRHKAREMVRQASVGCTCKATYPGIGVCQFCRLARKAFPGKYDLGS